jgi:hypothetical protein
MKNPSVNTSYQRVLYRKMSDLSTILALEGGADISAPIMASIDNSNSQRDYQSFIQGPIPDNNLLAPPKKL